MVINFLKWNEKINHRKTLFLPYFAIKKKRFKNKNLEEKVISGIEKTM